MDIENHKIDSINYVKLNTIDKKNFYHAFLLNVSKQYQNTTIKEEKKELLEKFKSDLIQYLIQKDDATKTSHVYERVKTNLIHLNVESDTNNILDVKINNNYFFKEDKDLLYPNSRILSLNKSKIISKIIEYKNYSIKKLFEDIKNNVINKFILEILIYVFELNINILYLKDDKFYSYKYFFIDDKNIYNYKYTILIVDYDEDIDNIFSSCGYNENNTIKTIIEDADIKTKINYIHENTDFSNIIYLNSLLKLDEDMYSEELSYEDDQSLETYSNNMISEPLISAVTDDMDSFMMSYDDEVDTKQEISWIEDISDEDLVNFFESEESDIVITDKNREYYKNKLIENLS